MFFQLMGTTRARNYLLRVSFSSTPYHIDIFFPCDWLLFHVTLIQTIARSESGINYVPMSRYILNTWKDIGQVEDQMREREREGERERETHTHTHTHTHIF